MHLCGIQKDLSKDEGDNILMTKVMVWYSLAYLLTQTENSCCNFVQINYSHYFDLIMFKGRNSTCIEA